MSSKIEQQNSPQDRILVVDDELDVNISLHMVLETNGFKVDSLVILEKSFRIFVPAFMGL